MNQRQLNTFWILKQVHNYFILNTWSECVSDENGNSKKKQKTNDQEQLLKIMTNAQNTLEKLVNAEDNEEEDDLKTFCNYIYAEMKKIANPNALKLCKRAEMNNVLDYQ